jgi:hypothetical protein
MDEMFGSWRAWRSPWTEPFFNVLFPSSLCTCSGKRTVIVVLLLLLSCFLLGILANKLRNPGVGGQKKTPP